METSVQFLRFEYEERSPWIPLSVELGFKPNENTLTLLNGGWSHMGNYGSRKHCSMTLAEALQPLSIRPEVRHCGGRADMFKKEGLSKEAVKDSIWNEAITPTWATSKGASLNADGSRAGKSGRVKTGRLESA